MITTIKKNLKPTYMEFIPEIVDQFTNEHPSLTKEPFLVLANPLLAEDCEVEFAYQKDVVFMLNNQFFDCTVPAVGRSLREALSGVVPTILIVNLDASEFQGNLPVDPECLLEFTLKNLYKNYITDVNRYLDLDETIVSGIDYDSLFYFNIPKKEFPLTSTIIRNLFNKFDFVKYGFISTAEHFFHNEESCIKYVQSKLNSYSASQESYYTDPTLNDLVKLTISPSLNLMLKAKHIKHCEQENRAMFNMLVSQEELGNPVFNQNLTCFKDYKNVQVNYIIFRDSTDKYLVKSESLKSDFISTLVNHYEVDTYNFYYHSADKELYRNYVFNEDFTRTLFVKALELYTGKKVLILNKTLTQEEENTLQQAGVKPFKEVFNFIVSECANYPIKGMHLLATLDKFDKYNYVAQMDYVPQIDRDNYSVLYGALPTVTFYSKPYFDKAYSKLLLTSLHTYAMEHNKPLLQILNECSFRNEEKHVAMCVMLEQFGKIAREHSMTRPDNNAASEALSQLRCEVECVDYDDRVYNRTSLRDLIAYAVGVIEPTNRAISAQMGAEVERAYHGLGSINTDIINKLGEKVHKDLVKKLPL